MEMLTIEEIIERILQALCDELDWGLRFYFAAKSLDKTALRLTPTLFDTFYASCLDDACLVLSRMVIAKEKPKVDDSVNVNYFLQQAEKYPSIFRFAKPGEIAKMIQTHRACLESHQSIIDVLKEQRDRNLAHLDRKHVKQPVWRENQKQLDLVQVENLYQDLIGILTTYYRLFYGGDFDLRNWEHISHTEVNNLIEYFDAYQLKA